jgi:N-acetylglucosaminyldiphosphoundecaprenol N-acetyl-beta-D-mannosaminyltransferase
VGRVRLLNAEVDLLTMDDLTGLVEHSIRTRRRAVVSNHNFHSLYLLHKSPELTRLYERFDYVHVDSMLLVFWGKMLGLPIRRSHRVAYIDWFPHLFRVAARKGWQMLYVGSEPGVAERAAHRFRQVYPDLRLKTMHGYFDIGSGSQACIRQVNSFAPDILFVGMGMPRQELWVSRSLEQLNVPAIFTSCGATMDFFAGVKPTPPRWAGQCGCEWLFRLVSEPRRLWRRYLAEPCVLFPAFLNEYRTKRLRAIG